MKKLELTLNLIIILLIISSSILMGMYIKDKGQGTVDFCFNHYRNETFLSVFIGDEPAEVKVCESDQWRTGTIMRYCNDTCFENIQKCLEENATDDQIRFMRNCHWMGPDYFITMGTLMFLYFIPLGLIGINIAILYGWNKKRMKTK